MKTFLPSVLFFSASLVAVNAQDLPPQIEQSRQYDAAGVESLPPDDSSLSSPMPPFAAESPGDDDLGQQVILKSKNVYQPLSAYAATNVLYTSNVGLTDGFEQDDWFWRSSLGVNYAPRWGNYLLANFSISQDVFRYDKFDGLDFESLNASAGLAYNLWFLYGINAGVEYNYNRLTSDGYGDEIFSSHSVTLSLSRNFTLSRAHYFYVVGGAEIGWSDPSEAERDEYSFLAGYHVRLARNFELDLSYRLGYYDYTKTDREDFNQTVQFSARYNFTKWLSANASISGSFNDSDRSNYDYQALNTGVGLFVSWKF